MPIRAHTRMELIRNIVGPSFKPTGHAWRVTFNPNLITALAKAIAEIGLPIRLSTPYTDPTGQARGNATYLQQYGLGNGG
ncbi:hypothetical protein OE165_27540, partial [Escherichia coli]|uniref:hypothetical protein n=1 Tax=Escherichia coli TaxID=562 RepID=UPI0021F311D5